MKSAPFLGLTAVSLPLFGLLAGLAIPPAPARAAEPINLNVRTAKDLAELCGAAPRSAGADAKINFCHGFAQGVVDMARAPAAESKPFCFPNPVPTRTKTLTEFVGWVRSNPDRQDLSATKALLQFLGERFPCKQ